MRYRIIHEEMPPAEKAKAAGDGNLAVPMRLKDFLVGVATIYDLPELRRKKKATKSPAPAPVATPAWQKQEKRVGHGIFRTHWLLIAAAVTSLIWGLDAIRKPPSEFGILPEAINGGWHTNDPRYRNRAFWIKGDRVAFQTGRDSMEVTIHRITQVDQTILGGDTLQYKLQYLADGAPMTWAIQFVQRPKPEIRFLNQRELAWTRAANSTWPTP